MVVVCVGKIIKACSSRLCVNPKGLAVSALKSSLLTIANLKSVHHYNINHRAGLHSFPQDVQQSNIQRPHIKFYTFHPNYQCLEAYLNFIR